MIVTGWKVAAFHRVQFLLDQTIVSCGLAHFLAGTNIDGQWGRQVLGLQLRFIPDLCLVGENTFWGSFSLHLGIDYEHFEDPTTGDIFIKAVFQKSRFPNGFGWGNFVVLHPRNFASNVRVVGSKTAIGGSNGIQLERAMNAELDPGHRTLLGNPVLEISRRPDPVIDVAEETSEEIVNPSFGRFLRYVLVMDVLANFLRALYLALPLCVFGFFLRQSGGFQNASFGSMVGICLLGEISMIFVNPLLYIFFLRLVCGGPGAQPLGRHFLFDGPVVWTSLLYAVHYPWMGIAGLFFQGTVGFNWVRRLMGAEIGKNVLVIGPMSSHPDNGKVQIGDNSLLFNSLEFGHTFEDWVYYSERTEIGDNLQRVV